MLHFLYDGNWAIVDERDLGTTKEEHFEMHCCF